VSELTADDDTIWQPAWTQAMSDFRATGSSTSTRPSAPKPILPALRPNTRPPTTRTPTSPAKSASLKQW
jgi:hypothetical protein